MLMSVETILVHMELTASMRREASNAFALREWKETLIEEDVSAVKFSKLKLNTLPILRNLLMSLLVCFFQALAQARPRVNASETPTVPVHWPASRELASIPALLFLADPMLTVSLKTTLPGADVLSVSRKELTAHVFQVSLEICALEKEYKLICDDYF
jgi:hypothetical protein